jgi:hypothetical protein
MDEFISNNLQDSLIYLTITDTNFAKSIIGQIPSEFFSSEISREVYDISTQFIRKFGEAPGKHFQDEILKKIDKIPDEQRESIARYLLHLENMGEPNKSYVYSRLNDFIRQRSLLNATYDFAELLEKNKIDEAVSKMNAALRKGLEVGDTGQDYFSSNDLEARGAVPERLFTLGIPILDKHIRLNRGELVALAGLKKGGKSWFCHYLVKQALKAGLKVLHVSHEQSLIDTIKRYDMVFGALCDAEEDMTLEFRRMDGNVIEKSRLTRGTIYDKELVKKVRHRMTQYGGELRIKKYPMGSCNINELESFINNLENFGNFVPDVLINDYADIMAAPTNSKKSVDREDINQTYMGLKGIADEKQILVINPSQINDDGAVSLQRFYTFDGQKLAEDKRKFAHIDKGFFVAVCSEENDWGFKESVIGVFANRNGSPVGRVTVGQNLSAGQFVLYSHKFEDKE